MWVIAICFLGGNIDSKRNKSLNKICFTTCTFLFFYAAALVGGGVEVAAMRR